MRRFASLVLGFAAALTFVCSASAQGVGSARDTVAGPTLTLDDALQLAARNNPDYLQSIANRRIAGSQLRQSYGQLLPQVAANFSSSYQRAGQQTIQGASFNVASDIYQSQYQLGVTYRLNAASFVNPKLYSASVAATEADIVGQRETVRGSVTQQYLAVLKAQAQAALQDSLVQTNETQLALAKAKLQVGSGTSLDVTRAEVDLGTQQVAALKAHNQVDVEKLRLFQRIGVMEPTNVQLTTTFAVAEPTFTLDSMLRLAKQQSPTLVALRSREHVADLGVRAARSDYLPSLYMSTGWGGYTYQLASPEGQIQAARFNALQQQASCYTTDSIRVGAGLPSIAGKCAAIGFTDAQAQAFRDQNKQFPFNFTKQPFSVFAQLSIPVFNGWTREYNVQQAQANREQALYNTRRTELAVAEAVGEAYLSLKAAAQTVAQQEQTVTWARDALRLAEERFRVGAGTSLDVTTARAAYERAETDRINAVYDYHTAFAALESAVGRPLR